ncbi:MAG: LapA family protein [Bacteroidia bacterium]
MEDYKKGSSNMLFVVLGVFILLLGIVFALQNSQVTPIKFLLWEFQGSLALVLAIVFVGGVLLGLFSIINNVWRRDRMISRQKKEMKNLNVQIQTLKEEKAALQNQEIDGGGKRGSSGGIKDFTE